MTEPETHNQRLLREIREKRDRLEAKVKAARARAASDPLKSERLVTKAASAELCRLRIPELEERIGRLEQRLDRGPFETH